MFLGKGALDPEGQNGFLDFALIGNFVGQKEVLGDLLGNGRCTDRPFTRAHIDNVGHSSTQDRGKIDPRVGEEVFVLGCDKGINHLGRDGRNRHKNTLFTRIFGNQCAVGCMHTRHDLGLVIFKLGVIGQSLAKVPEDRQHTGAARNRHQEQKAENTK